MNRSHNKKRNVGIIYDQIINFTCNNIIEENNTVAEESLEIIKKHFKKDTQLFKEYKLFKALATTHNVSDQLASNIISEAKKACMNMFDSNQLEKEKSILIKDLNYTFGKGKIFEEKVSNYRVYATIQTLLNEWRSDNLNFDLTTEYEIKLHNNLTRSFSESDLKPIKKVDNLTYSLMKEMFDKKYSGLLSESQKSIISLFINEEEEKLSQKLKEVKSDCLNKLNKYFVECSNKILLEKRNNVIKKIKILNEEDISKENIEKYLTVIKLKDVILGE